MGNQIRKKNRRNLDPEDHKKSLSDLTVSILKKSSSDLNEVSTVESVIEYGSPSIRRVFPIDLSNSYTLLSESFIISESSEL